MNALEATALASAGTLASAGLVAGGVAYAARWPTSRILGRALVDGPDPGTGTHTVALTYDDGPSPRNTPALLDLLGRHSVRATFFLIGNHVRREPALARRIAEAGHTLGNHTDMHPDLARKSSERIREELTRAQQTIVDATGVVPSYFRPPYGSRRPAVLRIARELSLEPVLWNVTAKDWADLPPAALLARVNAGLRKNQRRGRLSNVLFHDASHLDGSEPRARRETLAVTAKLLDRHDLRFVTLEEFDPR